MKMKRKDRKVFINCFLINIYRKIDTHCSNIHIFMQQISKLRSISNLKVNTFNIIIFFISKIARNIIDIYILGYYQFFDIMSYNLLNLFQIKQSHTCLC